MIFIFVGSPTMHIPLLKPLFFNSFIKSGAPIHAVSSSKVKEKLISLSKLVFEKIGA